jgi:hypothetical protein
LDNKIQLRPLQCKAYATKRVEIPKVKQPRASPLYTNQLILARFLIPLSGVQLAPGVFPSRQVLRMT